MEKGCDRVVASVLGSWDLLLSGYPGRMRLLINVRSQHLAHRSWEEIVFEQINLKALLVKSGVVAAGSHGNT